jgi:5-methylthioribose kinase
VFDQLRLDPYYRATALANPLAAPALERLIDSVWEHACCLVHADFSPKNLLVYSGGLMMVDFETGHYGDPAFDLGFFLSHLVLKAFYRAPNHEPLLALTERFWDAYRVGMPASRPQTDYADLVARAIQNFAGCAWARLDGKSKIEYLLDSPWRTAIRELCRQVLEERPATWADVLESCRCHLAR